MPKLGQALQPRRLYFDKLLRQFVCVLESTAPPAVRVRVHVCVRACACAHACVRVCMRVHVRENLYSKSSDSYGWQYRGGESCV